MKKKITIITISLIILLILGISFSSISNAAIEVKPGTTPHTSISASNSYQYCYDMRSSTSTLGNNSLDPHLTLNADWSAVSYLGASAYGNVRDVDGQSVTIGETTYNSTTKNITGVMNFGTNYTQTSSLRLSPPGSGSYTKIYNNIGTKYVETLDQSLTIDNSKGQALGETSGWWGSNADYILHNYPISIRYKIMGFTGSQYIWINGSSYRPGTGDALATITYRPVIWN